MSNSEIIDRYANLSPQKKALLEQKRKGSLGTRQHALRLKRRGNPGPAPLSFGQQRLWFVEQLEPGQPIYSIPVTVGLIGELNQEAFHRCFNEIMSRHESL